MRCARNHKTGRNTGREDVLWYNDRPTDDPVPMPDPQSGDVTDGSVDYYDFEWGETVHHVEDEMNRELPCFGCSGCNGGEAPTGECGDNQPHQVDENEYEMIEE